jgi:DNA-binding NarL/FixJ family response regulator
MSSDVRRLGPYAGGVKSESPATEPAKAARVITVVNIEDQREIREGLAVLIDATEGYRCVGRYRSMEEALAGIGPTGPDVALVDIGLPGMSGIDGIRILKERYPDIVPLVLTVYGDDARIFAALCAGACGYLLKKTPPARLLEGLREAVDGGSPMSPEVARRVISLFRNIRPPDAGCDLTPHETRLLRMMVEGHNYKTAAKAFGVTTHAISFHMRKIYEKLQVHSKSEAVAKALKNHLV